MGSILSWNRGGGFQGIYCCSHITKSELSQESPPDFSERGNRGGVGNATPMSLISFALRERNSALSQLDYDNRLPILHFLHFPSIFQAPVEWTLVVAWASLLDPPIWICYIGVGFNETSVEKGGGNIQELAKGIKKQTTAKPKSLIKCYVQLKEKKIPIPKAEGRIRNFGKG